MDTFVSTIIVIRKNGCAHQQFQQFLGEIETEYVDFIIVFNDGKNMVLPPNLIRSMDS